MIIYSMNYRDLDLNLLLLLEALYAEGSVTAAAARLKTSQPTASFGLNKLRAALGDELFVREGAGMRPTPFAQQIEEPVSRILGIVRQDLLRQRGFDPKTSQRSFAFSTSDIGELVFLPEILSTLRREAPGVTLRCLSLPPDELQQALADGIVDIAFGYFPDLQGALIYQQKLFVHPFTCVVRADHPLIGDGLTLEQFASLEHAVVEQKGRSQEIAEHRMKELGIERRIVLRSPHFMSVPLLVASSDLISIVPLAVGRAYARIAPLKLVPPPFDIPLIELKQFWHRRLHADPGVVWMRGIIARLYLNRDPSVDARSPIFRLP